MSLVVNFDKPSRLIGQRTPPFQVNDGEADVILLTTMPYVHNICHLFRVTDSKLLGIWEKYTKEHSPDSEIIFNFDTSVDAAEVAKLRKHIDKKDSQYRTISNQVFLKKLSLPEGTGDGVSLVVSKILDNELGLDSLFDFNSYGTGRVACNYTNLKMTEREVDNFFNPELNPFTSSAKLTFNQQLQFSSGQHLLYYLLGVTIPGISAAIKPVF